MTSKRTQARCPRRVTLSVGFLGLALLGSQTARATTTTPTQPLPTATQTATATTTACVNEPPSSLSLTIDDEAATAMVAGYSRILLAPRGSVVVRGGLTSGFQGCCGSGSFEITVELSRIAVNHLEVCNIASNCGAVNCVFLGDVDLRDTPAGETPTPTETPTADATAAEATATPTPPPPETATPTEAPTSTPTSSIRCEVIPGFVSFGGLAVTPPRPRVGEQVEMTFSYDARVYSVSGNRLLGASSLFAGPMQGGPRFTLTAVNAGTAALALEVTYETEERCYDSRTGQTLYYRGPFLTATSPEYTVTVDPAPTPTGSATASASPTPTVTSTLTVTPTATAIPTVTSPATGGGGCATGSTGGGSLHGVTSLLVVLWRRRRRP